MSIYYINSSANYSTWGCGERGEGRERIIAWGYLIYYQDQVSIQQWVNQIADYVFIMLSHLI